MQDCVATLVAGVAERLWAEFVYELLDILEVAVATRKQEILDIVGGRRCNRHI